MPASFASFLGMYRIGTFALLFIGNMGIGNHGTRWRRDYAGFDTGCYFFGIFVVWTRLDDSTRHIRGRLYAILRGTSSCGSFRTQLVQQLPRRCPVATLDFALLLRWCRSFVALDVFPPIRTMTAYITTTFAPSQMRQLRKHCKACCWIDVGRRTLEHGILMQLFDVVNWLRQCLHVGCSCHVRGIDLHFDGLLCRRETNFSR